MSSGAIEAVSAPRSFLHKEGLNIPAVYLDTDTEFLFIPPSLPSYNWGTLQL